MRGAKLCSGISAPVLPDPCARPRPGPRRRCGAFCATAAFQAANSAGRSRLAGTSSILSASRRGSPSRPMVRNTRKARAIGAGTLGSKPKVFASAVSGTQIFCTIARRWRRRCGMIWPPPHPSPLTRGHLLRQGEKGVLRRVRRAITCGKARRSWRSPSSGASRHLLPRGEKGIPAPRPAAYALPQAHFVEGL